MRRIIPSAIAACIGALSILVLPNPPRRKFRRGGLRNECGPSDVGRFDTFSQNGLMVQIVSAVT
jgi:hypothetical protein